MAPGSRSRRSPESGFMPGSFPAIIFSAMRSIGPRACRLSEPQALVSVAAEDVLYRPLHVSAIDGDRVTRAAFLTNGQYDRELSVHWRSS